MACEFCSDAELVNGMNYCPYCGNNLTIGIWIAAFLQAENEKRRRIFLQAQLEKERANETVEIDGEILTVERIPSPAKEARPTPLDYSFNPDKIDISKEMAMLEKHYNPFAKHCEYISERLDQMMKEKENENII